MDLVTLFVGRYDALTGIVDYVNCGHETGMILRCKTGRVDELPTTGMALGAYEHAAFDIASAQMDPGDILVTYSDGFTEAGIRPSAFLNCEGVATVLRRQHPVSDPDRLIDRFVSAVDKRARGRFTTINACSPPWPCPCNLRNFLQATTMTHYDIDCGLFDPDSWLAATRFIAENELPRARLQRSRVDRYVAPRDKIPAARDGRSGADDILSSGRGASG